MGKNDKKKKKEKEGSIEWLNTKINKTKERVEKSRRKREELEALALTGGEALLKEDLTKEDLLTTLEASIKRAIWSDLKWEEEREKKLIHDDIRIFKLLEDAKKAIKEKKDDEVRKYLEELEKIPGEVAKKVKKDIEEYQSQNN